MVCCHMKQRYGFSQPQTGLCNEETSQKGFMAASSRK